MKEQQNNETDYDWTKDKVSQAYHSPEMNLRCLQLGAQVKLEEELVKQLNLMTSVINHSLREVGVELNMSFINILNEDTNPDRNIGFIRCKIIKPKQS